MIFTVKRLSPTCETVARFTVRGHAGLNRIRFASRVGRKQLGAGTYQISARRRDGWSVQRVTVVVIEGGAPTRAELAALRVSNVCPATRDFASTAAMAGSTGAFSAGAFSEPEDLGGLSSPDGQPSAGGATNPDSGGVLGSTPVEKTVRALRPALIALLAASILLLGLASLPRVVAADARINDVLARHRVEIAGVGTAALVGVIIAFLLG